LPTSQNCLLFRQQPGSTLHLQDNAHTTMKGYNRQDIQTKHNTTHGVQLYLHYRSQNGCKMFQIKYLLYKHCVS